MTKQLERDKAIYRDGFHAGLQEAQAQLADCRWLLRFALKVIAHGTDVQLIDARNFIEARLAGSDRTPSSVIEHLWKESK